MKRQLNITDDMLPPRKRFKTLHIRRPGYTPRYPTRSVAFAAVAIQRFWRWARTMIPANNTGETGTLGNIRKSGKDVICPITQDAIPSSDCFKFVSSTGHVYAYTVADLVAYFKSSGSFRCPLTREEFHRHTVFRLARKALSRGLQATTLSGMFEMRHSIMRRTIERDNRLLAIENQCGIAMTECIDMCQNMNVSTTAAANQLLNYLIPEWKELVDQYARFSFNDCKLMLLADRDKLLRLRRSDIRDPHQLLSMVCAAIEDKIHLVQNPRPPVIRRLFPPTLFEMASRLERLDPDTAAAGETAASVVSSILGEGDRDLNSALDDINRRLVSTLTQNQRGGRFWLAIPPPPPHPDH